MAKGSKLLQYINYRVRVTIQTESHERRPRRLRGLRNLPLVKGAAAAGGKKPGEEREDRLHPRPRPLPRRGGRVHDCPARSLRARARRRRARTRDDATANIAPACASSLGPANLLSQVVLPPAPGQIPVRCQSSCGCSTAIPGAATDAEGPSPAMRPGMPVPLPPRVGMPPPLGGPVPVFAPPRPGMPPPPPPPNQH
ncbi:hypothetical protein B296_00047618 [Ensete ventricosum]|uniref:Uncharacterized protein n=1 Tax=Ensete ventricosum TaxID=4639 RepID=A0A426YYK4_ENSVE|nr:hypothetical protein B296_00047618 [Ensete ventricosum]